MIHELRPLVTNAVPVLHNLASPQTGLHELFVALNRASEQAAPVAQQQANYYTYLDKFFTDWASVARSIEEANTGGPPSLEQAIYSLPHEAAFYENATKFMNLLHPSAKSLVKVAPELGHAFSVGTTNLAAATQLNDALLESSQALAEFAANPIAQVGLEEFTNTLEIANPLLAGIAPSQAFCNYWTLAFRNLASLETENIGIGTLARAGFILAPSGPNNEGYPASAPANGALRRTRSRSPRRSSTSTTTTCTRTCTRTPPAPASRRCAKRATRPTSPGRPSIGNLPAADVTKNREFTSREQNVYGEKYPAATLKALGLSSSSKGEEGMKRPRFWRRHDEIPVVELSRANPVRAGVIMIVAIVVVVYFGFTKKIPFKHGYTIHAEFASAQDIHPKSPVRVAGVDVGTRSPRSSAKATPGLVTMEIETRGLPIHSDATMKIRPRIFLEGNWFVELQPGSPSAPELHSGRHDPDRADRRPGAARPGARRAQHRHARKPAALPDLLRPRPHRLARAEGERRTGTGSPRHQRGPGAQQDLPHRPALAAGHGRRPAGLRRRHPGRPLEADRLDRQGDRGPERPRTGARRTDRQLQHLLRRLRRRSRRASPSSSPNCPATCQHQGGLRGAARPRSGRPRPSPTTSSRASNRPTRRSPRRCRGSNRCRPRSGRTSSAGWRADW